jgi:AsmA protein
MEKLPAKRKLWIGLGLLVVILVAGALASSFAGTKITALNLAKVLEDVSGRRVTVESTPVIRIFPALTAELRGVSFHNRGYASDQFPVLKAPVMRLSFSMFAALRGEARITGVVLEKPVFRAKAEDTSWQLPLSAQSKLSQLLGVLTASVPQEQFAAGLAEALGNALGKITVKDGTILLDQTSTNIISGIDVIFSWMPGNSQARLSGKATWRGQPISLNATTDDIIMLAAGADTGIAVDFQAEALTSRFSGNVRLMPSPFFEGTVFAKTGSIGAATHWIGMAAPDNFAGLAMSLSGALKGDSEKWQLEESKLQLGSNEGEGGLIFQPGVAQPLLSGTLDFETLDLAQLMQVFRPKTNQNSIPALAADLRISAATARFAALTLNKVAASLQISQQASTLDIHNASAFGGTLQMAIKNSAEPHIETEIRVLANDIETKALESLTGPIAGLPQARGSLSAILHGPGSIEPAFFNTAEGTVKLRLGAGTIPGLNANQIVKALRQGGFFALKAEAPSTLSFTELNAEAALAQGTLQLDTLYIGLEKAALTLTGTYAVKDQSLALTGMLDLAAGHPEAPDGAERLKVFFGGNREAPLMSGLQ